MRRLLLAIVLLSTTWAMGQASYTGVTTGDWKTPANWTFTGTPCNTTNHYPVYNGDPASSSTACGDIVVQINDGVVITCSSGIANPCTVGNSPTTNTAVLTASGKGCIALGTNAVLIYAGRVQFTSCTITMGAGSKLQYDSSYATSNATTVRYTWDCTAANCSASAPKWAVTGTSGSHAVIEGDSFYSPYNKVATCTAANQCQAGSFNFGNGLTAFSTSDQGTGSISYLDVKDVYGTQVNSLGILARRSTRVR